MKITLTDILFFSLGILLCFTVPYFVYGDINLELSPINGSITGKYYDATISISLSDSCIALNTLDNSPCPSYKLLYDNKLDTSKIQSGEFKVIDGIFKRKASNIKNEEQLYAYEPYNLILDPSYRMQLKTKTIYLVPSLDSYIPQDAKIKVNNTRTVFMDRIIDDNCRIATLSSTNWKFTLADTIYLMRNNCDTKYTNMITKEIITDNSTEIDITTTSQYKYNQWLQDAIERSKKTILINNDK